MHSFEGNRVVRDTGARYPIFNAPIGYFARTDLASAVSDAGGMGLLELHTATLDETARDHAEIRSRTDAPFGVHMWVLAQLAKQNVDDVLDWALGHTSFMTTGLGPAATLTPRIKDAGITVYHQVTTLDEALKAVDAGVDGLIVEGAEAGGLRGVTNLHLFSLLQQIRPRVDVPLVAAGGIADGYGMAGAFALGAEGVVMGTRFMSSRESPSHDNWKQAVADCDVTLAVDVIRPGDVTRPLRRMRAVRNEFSEAVARGDIDTKGNPYGGSFFEVFTHGRLDKAMVGAGETASLISSIKPVAEIIDETVSVFWQEIERLAGMLRSSDTPAPA